MRTKAERIKMVERNLAENDENLKAGRITAEQHEERRKDGARCIAEIRARKTEKKVPTK